MPEEKTESEDPDYDDNEEDTPVAAQTTAKSTAVSNEKADQPELDFGF